MRTLLAMREGLAIAMREFCFPLWQCRIEAMKTIAEIQRALFTLGRFIGRLKR